MAVKRVTVHHEGAGRPRQVDLSKSGYTASVFPGGTDVWRKAVDSWATRHYNHVSYDIVLTGDRDTWLVTTEDLAHIGDLVAAGVASGEIDPDFEVHPHGTLHPPPAGYPTGSDPTECPGVKTIAVWPALVVAAHGQSKPTPPISSSEEPMLIAAPTQPDPNQWRGAVVDVAKRTMVALGGAVISPGLDPVEQSSPWVGVDETGPGAFTIVADTPDKRNNAPYRHTVT